MHNRFAVLAAGILCAASAWSQQYLINSIAGNGTDASTGDGGPAAQSEVSSPNAIAYDPLSGKIYIADSGAYRVRVILPNGTINTFAGNGTEGYSGDGGAATSAELGAPSGVAVDSQGNVYISDQANHVLREVTINNGIINTIAGDEAVGGGYSGDGGLAVNAQLYAPAGLAFDNMGNLYIADQGNGVIRVIDPTGEILTMGGGTFYTLSSPSAVAADAQGNVYVADTDNNRISMFSVNGKWSTVAGNGTAGFSGDNGPATRAELSSPHSVAVDQLGQIYICDTINGRIRLVTTSGTIQTIVGNGTLGYGGDGGPALSAALFLPRGVALDPAGDIYISDTNNHRIREAIAIPQISQGGIVNAASFTAPLAPGELATVFGQHFSNTTVGATAPLGDALGGASVSVNGNPAGLLYVTPFQINFQVPSITQAGNATVTVSFNNQTSSSATVPVVTAAPGIFEYGSGRAVVQNADYSTNSDSSPAQVGSTITAYLTGAGPLQPAVPDGTLTPNSPLSTVTSTVSATIGTTAAKVSFAGLTPGFIGLEQMNIVVPSTLTTGDYPLTVTVNGQASNSATISVTQ